MSSQINDSRPPPPSWLDKNFIQQSLKTENDDQPADVVSFELSMANAMGDGYLSDMYRIVVKLAGSMERRFVVKCQPQGGMQGEFANKLDVYSRETKMLSETLPAMNKLLERVGIHQPLAAKCFHHGKHPTPFLVLEDLRWSGFTTVNRTGGLDLNHCRLVMKSLALFHASSLALLQQNPTAIECYNESLYCEAMREVFTPFYEQSMQTIEKTVSKWPGYERFSDKLRNIRINVFDRLLNSMECRKGKLNTLIHGDTWTNNMMFSYSEGAVEDMRLLDFQTCHYSSPAIDLQHFLTTCPNEETRDSVDGLLEEYHQIFTETLEKLQCHEHIISFEELKRDFEERAMYGLCAACSILPFVMSDAAKQLTLDDIISSGDATAGIFEEMERDGVYERILKKLLVNFESLGVL